MDDGGEAVGRLLCTQGDCEDGNVLIAVAPSTLPAFTRTMLAPCSSSKAVNFAINPGRSWPERTIRWVTRLDGPRRAFIWKSATLSPPAANSGMACSVPSTSLKLA